MRVNSAWKLPIHFLEHGVQPLAALAVQVADRAAQLGDRGGQFLAFRGRSWRSAARLRSASTSARRFTGPISSRSFTRRSWRRRALSSIFGGQFSRRVGQGGVGAKPIQDAFGDSAPGVVGLLRHWPRRAPPARARAASAASAARAARSASPSVWVASRQFLRGAPVGGFGGLQASSASARRAAISAGRACQRRRASACAASRRAAQVGRPGTAASLARGLPVGPFARRCAVAPGRRGRRARAPACRVRCARRFRGSARRSARPGPAPPPPRSAAQVGQGGLRVAARGPGRRRPPAAFAVMVLDLLVQCGKPRGGGRGLLRAARASAARARSSRCSMSRRARPGCAVPRPWQSAQRLRLAGALPVAACAACSAAASSD